MSGCGQRVYFDKVRCERRRAQVRYLPHPRYERCQHSAAYWRLHWMVPGDESGFCVACRLNEVIP